MTKLSYDYRTKDYFLLLTLLCAGLLITDSIIFYFFNQAHYFKENGLIENIQVMLLLFGLIFYSFHLFNKKTYRGIVSVSVVICIGFLLREVDVEKLIPSISIFVKGKGKALILITLVILSSYALYKDIKHNKVLKHIVSPFSLCITFCADFLILSWLFDKEIFDLQNNLIYEEISEINAYTLITIAAFLIPKKV